MAGIFDQLTEKQPDADFSENAPEQPLQASSDANDAEENDAEENDAEARTEQKLREASQELLRFGLIEQSHKPNVYRVAQNDMQALNDILEPLDLQAHIDDIRGLIFLKVRNTDILNADDEWSHPLARKQRLTLEQSLLVAMLRQNFIAYEQEAGTGASQALVAVDELIPQLQVYLGDTGSEARERKRTLQLLDQLKGHGLVSSPDAHDRVAIRPIIAHLANPENLQALLAELKQRLTADDDLHTNEHESNQGEAQ